MILIKQVTTNSRRRFVYPLLLLSPAAAATTTSTCASAFFSPILPSSFFCSYYISTAHKFDDIQIKQGLNSQEIAFSFKEWFKRGNNPWFDLIFDIIRDNNNEVALWQLGLRPTEKLVLDVLSYGFAKRDILSCLKFFDWVGRQPGFFHTRATFCAIFKILSRAKLMSLMLEFLDNCVRDRLVNYKCRFHSTVVMGYAVAGKPQIALQLFGRMRFQGIDLDAFSYHVLLNALVEEGCFDAVEAISRQISVRGFENSVTHCIMVKSLCKRKMLDEAESYVRRALEVDDGYGYGNAVSFLVDAFCQNNRIVRAGQLLEEFRDLGVTPIEAAYGVWLRYLIKSGRVNGAVQFLKSKKSSEGYSPEVYWYNMLLCLMLRKNQLQEAYDLLIEMKEDGIIPNKVTVNAALCFFCKAGMVDVALELYNSRSEYGLLPDIITYECLINSLYGDGSIDDAYHVLSSFTEKGLFPSRRTFSNLADALCKEGKIDEMRKLITVALEKNFALTDSTYDKFISALCRARKVEEGYLIHEALNRKNRIIHRSTYADLVCGFSKSKKGDIASRLLIEMQDKGYTVTRGLVRAVIAALCNMENPEMQFFKLLEMQLSRHGQNLDVYNHFISAAKHAKRPELARQALEMMQRSGIAPNVSSDILMLQSLLNSERVSDALNFFESLHQRRKIGRKLYNAMVVGLCKIKRVDLALDFMREMRCNGLVPSNESYEELVKVLCSTKNYAMAIDIIKDLEKVGRRVTSFLGNVLLLHSLKDNELYVAWVRSKEVQNETSSKLAILGQLIGAFSGCIEVSPKTDELEEVIEQCFPLDIYTYNMLLRRLTLFEMDDINDALKLLNRIYKKGYEPNRWTYDTLVHGLLKNGRTVEAKIWLEKMLRRGFDPTECTKELILI